MRKTLLILLLFTLSEAKELFTEKLILEYFTESNPFYYETIAKQQRLQNRDMYYRGDLDYETFMKYDYKAYPSSEGEFIDVGMKKPFENGIEASLSYRKAEGEQEYNNIKTGDEGEVLLGVKLPLVSLLRDTNQRKLNIHTAGLENNILDYHSKDNLRTLYFNVLLEYAKVLYTKSIIELQEELLYKAQQRKEIIQNKISVGSLATISLVEAKQQIINREQALLNSINDHTAAMENFLQYLDISKERFENTYELSHIHSLDFEPLDLDSLMDDAMENRYDLKQFDIKLQQLSLKQKQTSLLNYPKVDLSMYGVHDFEYDDGYKVSLDINFPLQRRKYDAANIENRKHILENQMAKEKALTLIRTNLKNIVNAFRIFSKNFQSSQEEITLLEQLEKAENTRYVLGSSNLFILNQREMLTLKVKKKALYYKYKLYILEKEAHYETGSLSGVY